MSDLNEQLLPCPFCASDDLDNQVSEFGNEFIQCRKCGGDGPLASSDETAEAAWNRRAPAAAPAPVAANGLMELRARIQEMQEAAYTYGEYSKGDVRTALDGVLDEIDELAEAAVTAAAPIVQPVTGEPSAAGQWISIDDKQPENGVDVIVLFWPYDNRENEQQAASAHHMNGVFYDEDCNDMHPPSHWMPFNRPAANGAEVREAIATSADEVKS